MSEEKTVLVDEETWKKIVEELGYEPSNLKVTKFIPKGQAILIDTEKPKQPFFKGYKPTNYFNV